MDIALGFAYVVAFRMNAIIATFSRVIVNPVDGLRCRSEIFSVFKECVFRPGLRFQKY